MAEAQEVKKLDIPSRFDEIKTNLKTSQALKKHEKERYSVWFNYFKETGSLKVPKNKSDILWVAKSHKDIENYITATYKPPKASASTYRNHLEGLANILLAINKTKFKETVRPFFVEGLQLQKGIDEKQEDSELTEKERANFVCFSDIVEQRDKLHEEWMIRPKDKKLNMYHLILAFNSYFPPLRLNLIDMEIWKKSIPPPSDVETNYLWQTSLGQWAIVINHDKIEHRRVDKGLEREVFELANDIQGVTEGKKLNSIINDSLKYFPRDFVLAGVRTDGSPMGKSSYDQALASIFKPKRPTQNILRKSYVNYWYNKNLPMSRLKEIARRMRHTVGVAMSVYKKVNIDCPEPGDIEGITVPTKIDIPPPKVKSEYFNPSKYAKDYREKHEERLKLQRKINYDKNKTQILRTKQLWYLNRNLVKNPTKRSVEKYKLKYNPAFQQWE